MGTAIIFAEATKYNSLPSALQDRVLPASTPAFENGPLPARAGAANTEEWLSRHHEAELNVREFLESRNLLTLPSWLHHFALRPMPTYLKPLSAFTETDDFTSPSRLDQDSVRRSVSFLHV